MFIFYNLLSAHRLTITNEILIMVDARWNVLVRNLLMWWCRIMATLVKTGKLELVNQLHLLQPICLRLLELIVCWQLTARRLKFKALFDIPVDHLMGPLIADISGTPWYDWKRLCVVVSPGPWWSNPHGYWIFEDTNCNYRQTSECW